MIRPVEIDDVQQLLDIYNYYVINSVVTFDIEPLSFEAFKSKVSGISKNYPFLVYEEDGAILGFAYGSMYRPKPAYQKTVETTIYLKHTSQGKKIGSHLYTELLKRLKQVGFHTVLGVLTLPNIPSVKLHETLGFTKVAELKEVGFKFDVWQDVGIWQLKWT